MPWKPASPHGGESRRVGAIIVAAGESRRMGGQDKIFTTILGKPLLAYATEAMESSPHVQEIVLVVPPNRIETGWEMVKDRGYCKVTAVCQGGERRQDSVKCGLDRLSPCQWVVVHDGARPCLEPELVFRGLEAAEESGAAVAAVPAKDTIKIVTASGMIESTPERDRLWMVQTPQVFQYGLLMEAHRRCSASVTDDAAMVESLGHQVKVFMGSYSNLKVTTPQDILLAGILLQSQAAGRPG